MHKYIVKLRAKEGLAIAPGTLANNSVILLGEIEQSIQRFAERCGASEIY
jgi:hypothetical protein